MFEATEWQVRCGEHIYKAIGYERRGIFGVPVSDCIDGHYICCEVYELIKGYRTITPNMHISVGKPNKVELALLKDAGYKYDGCWVTKE